MPKTLIALQSVVKFADMVLRRDLRLVRDRLGAQLRVKESTYSIFRETQKMSTEGETVVLVIGFRLKLIRSSRLLHYLFQRICIFTTPFWSGLPGFKVKLWMVDPVTKNYLGIYDWRDREQAAAYIGFLLPILRFFSVPGSVWANQFLGQDFELYLKEHAL